MTGSRNLLDPLSKNTAPTHQIGNLSLVQRNFNRARSNVVCRAMNIGKHRVHLSPFQNKRRSRSRTCLTIALVFAASIVFAVARSCRHSERSEESPHLSLQLLLSLPHLQLLLFLLCLCSCYC